MELTIEQALQHGVAAHKEGKLQDAEHHYRAILQSQPLHPDANHNLGILEVSMNKSEAALPLFKAALKANPKMEQFWLSYIDALIKERQFDNAKHVVEQAKKQFQRGLFKGQTSYKDPIREMSLKSAAYRRPGRGRGWQQAWWLDALVSEDQARRLIETSIGPLAGWRPRTPQDGLP